VAAVDLYPTIAAMDLTLDMAIQMCPHFREGKCIARVAQMVLVHLPGMRRSGLIWRMCRSTSPSGGFPKRSGGACPICFRWGLDLTRLLSSADGYQMVRFWAKNEVS
jgi:hypothetical protein